jgi:hypothetical protein
MVAQAILNLLVNLCAVVSQAFERWWVVAAISFILGGLFMLAFGSIRWWWVRTYRGEALWKYERDAYETELKGCHDYIRKLEKSMHVYMELAHVRAVKNVKDYENNSLQQPPGVVKSR